MSAKSRLGELYCFENKYALVLYLVISDPERIQNIHGIEVKHHYRHHAINILTNQKILLYEDDFIRMRQSDYWTHLI